MPRKIRIKRRPKAIAPTPTVVLPDRSLRDVVYQGGETVEAIGEAFRAIGKFARHLSRYI